MKKKWYNNFWILLVITIIDLFILDPIPLIDEIVLVGWTSYLGFKGFKK